MADSYQPVSMKAKYYAMIKEMSKHKPQKKLMTRQWYEIMVQRIESAKEIVKSEGIKKLPSIVRDALDNYDVININHQDTLVHRLKEESAPDRIIVALEKSYEIVVKAHVNTDHGGVPLMKKWLSDSNYVVAEICLPVLINVCQKCLQGTAQDEPKTDKYTNIALIGFANMSSQPDQSFRYLLIYQDIMTKFVQLRPITIVDEDEISMELIKLFNDFPLPQCFLVESKMSRLFKRVLVRLNGLFQREISLEVCNSYKQALVDVKNKIIAWIEDSNCQNWSVGCHYVQWDINSIPNYNGSPYEKFFGLKKVAIDDYSEESHRQESHRRNQERAKQNLVTITVSDSDSDHSSQDTVSVRSEPEAIIVKDNETFSCCTCKGGMKNLIYTCCVCKRTLHLYCGARRQGPNDTVETICYTCLHCSYVGST